MNIVDTGGSIAIKGFNYQKASMILVMIKNYRKNNFMVIPEARDDFEVRYEDESFFIQAKGTKNLSLSDLTRQSKNKKKEIKPSILEKNIIPGDKSNIRKIFLWSIINSTKKNLKKVSKDRIVSPIYKFSDEQKEEIISKLNLNQEQVTRLNNQFIFITPFKNNNKIAITFLKGEMVNEGLMSSNQRAQVILGELVLQIDQKSEIEIIDERDYDKKIINGNYLHKIFTTVEQMQNFDRILNNLPISSMKKMKIKNEKVKIPLLFQNIKSRIKEKISVDELLEISDLEALKILINLAEKENDKINNEQLWALAIECYCELGEERSEN